LVPDLNAARYLQGLFPGSRIERLDVGLPEGALVNKGGRPRKYSSNAARVAQQRKAAREKLLNPLREVIGKRLSQDHLKDGESEYNTRAENPIEFLSTIGMAVSDGSLFSGKNRSQPFGYLSCQTIDGFMYMLKAFHSRKLPRKEDNQLISPSLFDPALSPDHDRGRENVVYCRHLYLDFENGDLKPEEFPDLFPQLRMIVTNTFNHTPENPRFRVVIPTSDVVPPEVYSILQSQITSKLEEAGYTVEETTTKKKIARTNTLRSGLDTGKQAPESLFYLPSQAQNPKDSFFRYYDDQGREILDAMIWVENSLIPIAPEPAEWDRRDDERSDTIDQAAVDSAVARWQTTPKGHGHDAFFQLAVDLRGAGMGAADIKATLQIEAQSVRSKRDRNAEIRSILETLRKKSRATLKD
jgi:hypothetical protein